ncbi:MAG: transglutaminase-like domain-containing protein [Gemmatales bacterium]
MKVMTMIAWLLLVPFAVAEPPRQAKILNGPAVAAGKLVREVWVKRYTEQGRLGWMQTLSFEVTVEGQPLIRTVIRDHLRYLRSGDPYSEDTEQYSVETVDGTVVEVGYRSPLGKNQDLVIRGRPSGKQIVLEVLDHTGKSVVYQQVKPWDTRARGILFQDKLLEGKDLSVGKSYTVHGFLTVLNDVAPTTYTVLGRKQITVAGKKVEAIEVEQSYPKECYLEKTRHYLDPATGQTLLSTEDNSLFDMVSHERCDRDAALAAFPGTVKDKDSPVTIDKPFTLGLLGGLPGRIRIAIEMTEDDSPEAVFHDNKRQKFLKKAGNRGEFLLASKQLDDWRDAPEPAPAAEFLASNFYIRSDDALVKKLAKEAIRDASDAKLKMERITRWVKNKVKGGYEVGFATADEVARTLEGDCTEMGVLAAAMGRAVGVPTRVCFGLVYDPDNPGFAGHLWSEAYVNQRWQTFDPTGVIDSVAAAYLRIDGVSLSGVLSPDEISSVRRGFAGRMKVFVLEAK